MVLLSSGGRRCGEGNAVPGPLCSLAVFLRMHGDLEGEAFQYCCLDEAYRLAFEGADLWV